jgi:nicotinamide-nucleotide amidase
MTGITSATIITIGDELLIGQTVDTNSAWMAQQLNKIAVDVRRRIAVGDTREAILGALDEELPRTDILLLTGGLGPTADDITKPLLAEYFDGPLVVDEKVLEHVKEMFRKRNRPLLDRNLKQAEVPQSCTVLHNRMGTAPGMWFEKDNTIVVALPGVPFEMMAIMEDEVLRRLRQRITSGALVHRNIITAGEGESFIAQEIEDIEAALPSHIKLAYLPSPGLVKLRLTGRGADERSLIKEVELHRDAIAGRIEKLVVGLEDLPLEHLLGKVLTTKGVTLGLAESCTGGYIAHLITQIMGSAGYLQGSIVCYQESVKEDILNVQRATIDSCCVVSEEVAKEMAQGAMKSLKADIGFGVTGLLSPAGEDRVDVGTVCVACSNKDRTVSKTFHFHMDRIRNKELAAQNSLLFIWRFIHDLI